MDTVKMGSVDSLLNKEVTVRRIEINDSEYCNQVKSNKTQGMVRSVMVTNRM